MDSFSNDLEASLVEECTCSICMDIFEQPIQLPCQHSFCRDCLRSYANSKPSRILKCPMCNTEHKINSPGDISQFPVDLFAKRIVSHIKTQRTLAAKRPVPVSSIAPEVVAQATAPDAEEEVENIQTSRNPTQHSGGLKSNLPPMEQFVQPSKPPFTTPNPPASPSIWSKLFSRSHSSISMESSAASSPSTAPETASSAPAPPASSSSYAPSSSSGLSVSSSAPSSTSVASSSSAASYLPTLSHSSLTRSNDTSRNSEQLSNLDFSLSLSRAEHHSKRKRSPPIEMPPGLMPPRALMMQECRPMFDKEEIWMPFVIPQSDVRSLWSRWQSTLWWADNSTCHLQGTSQVLCPAWRIAGSITIHYTAVASLRIQKDKGHVILERHHQTGSLRLNEYASVVCGIDSSVPFANLMKLCILTDQLPLGESPSFMQWVLGTRATPREMQDYPAPDGALLERDPDWYRAWQESANDLPRQSYFTAAIQQAIRSKSPGLATAEIDISEITIVGFHSLMLTPIRIPMYLCAYTHPSRSSPYHFVMSGQNGEIHDGADRPMTVFGSIMKGIFGGAFSK